MRVVINLFLILVILVSCNDDSKYSGYSETKNGLYYKIHSLGEDFKEFSKNDVINFNYKIFYENDSLVASGNLTMIYTIDSYSKWNEFIHLLANGDSASAYFDKVEELPFDGVYANVGAYRVEIGVNSIMDVNYAKFLNNYPNLVKLLIKEEQIELSKILSSYNQDSIQYYKGIFVVHQVIGHGKSPLKDDEIFVDYILSRVNGEQLDSSFERGIPFSFIKGTKGQVIDGFSIGIETMKKGGKATFIIPSYFAFGKQGSSTGIVKKNQPIICDIFIKDIHYY